MAQPRRRSPQHGPTWPPYLGQPCPKTPGGEPSVAWGSGFFAACLFLFAFVFVFWRFLRASWANIASSRANIAPRWLNLTPTTDQHSHTTTQHSPKMGQHSPKMDQHRPTLAESALHWPRIGLESSPFPLCRPAPGCQASAFKST